VLLCLAVRQLLRLVPPSLASNRVPVSRSSIMMSLHRSTRVISDVRRALPVVRLPVSRCGLPPLPCKNIHTYAKHDQKTVQMYVLQRWEEGKQPQNAPRSQQPHKAYPSAAPVARNAASGHPALPVLPPCPTWAPDQTPLSRQEWPRERPASSTDARSTYSCKAREHVETEHMLMAGHTVGKANSIVEQL
jgi:hypothetical protein